MGMTIRGHSSMLHSPTTFRPLLPLRFPKADIREHLLPRIPDLYIWQQRPAGMSAPTQSVMVGNVPKQDLHNEKPTGLESVGFRYCTTAYYLVVAGASVLASAFFTCL